MTANAIATNAVTANAIASNVIDADKIVTSALVGLLIQTAASGNMIKLSTELGIWGDIIKFYDQSGHFSGGVTATDENTITIGVPGYTTNQGVLKLGASKYVEFLDAVQLDAAVLPSGSVDIGSSSAKIANLWVTTLHQGDSIFANNWRLTEDGTDIVLRRPNGSVAARWKNKVKFSNFRFGLGRLRKYLSIFRN